MFKRAIALFTAGVMMAGMIAATGSMGVMAAENTTEAAAKEIALKDAGLKAESVTFERVEMGTEQGASVYEIEFRTKDTEYDYDIATADGEIVKASRELTFPSANGNQISETEAKQRAVIDAGVDEKNVTFTKFESGSEDGIPVYEIEFETETRKYDYDVAKAGGMILNTSEEVKVPASVAAKQKAGAAAATGKTGSDAAIEAALGHAGFSADEVYGLRCKKDYDDGREIYDVEFKKDGREYNYDIDAGNYSIIEWDVDYDD